MNWIQRQWQHFKEKSFWGKFWDILLASILVLMLFPGGRELVQRAVLKTGLMGNTTANLNEALTTESANWLLTDLNGEIHRFGDLNVKPIFLNHWATWCPPCKAEMPSIIDLIETSGDRAHFILVTSEDVVRVRAFLKQQGWQLPVYFPKTPVPAQLHAASLPTTLVIDGSGKIIHRSEGMRDWGSDKASDLVVGGAPFK